MAGTSGGIPGDEDASVGSLDISPGRTIEQVGCRRNYWCAKEWGAAAGNIQSMMRGRGPGENIVRRFWAGGGTMQRGRSASVNYGTQRLCGARTY